MFSRFGGSRSCLVACPAFRSGTATGQVHCKRGADRMRALAVVERNLLMEARMRPNVFARSATKRRLSGNLAQRVDAGRVNSQQPETPARRLPASVWEA